MMAAQNEVKCGAMEFSCPIIFFSFVQMIIPLWAFLVPSAESEGKKMKGEARKSLAALYLVTQLIMQAHPGTGNAHA